MSDLLFTSLMDLATTDTSEIKALRNRLQPEGIYVVAFTEANLREIENQDPSKPPRASLGFKGVVEHFEPLKADSSDRDLVGKAYNQFETIWLSDIAEAIGLLKGRYESAHLPTAGIPGGIEGHEGWIDGVIGKRVAIRVRHKVVGDDTRVYVDWLGAKAMEKVGLAWEDMGREAVDGRGNPIEIA